MKALGGHCAAQAQGVLGQAANIKEFAKRGKDPVGALHPARPKTCASVAGEQGGVFEGLGVVDIALVATK